MRVSREVLTAVVANIVVRRNHRVLSLPREVMASFIVTVVHSRGVINWSGRSRLGWMSHLVVTRRLDCGLKRQLVESLTRVLKGQCRIDGMSCHVVIVSLMIVKRHCREMC